MLKFTINAHAYACTCVTPSTHWLPCNCGSAAVVHTQCRPHTFHPSHPSPLLQLLACASHPVYMHVPAAVAACAVLQRCCVLCLPRRSADRARQRARRQVARSDAPTDIFISTHNHCKVQKSRNTGSAGAGAAPDQLL